MAARAAAQPFTVASAARMAAWRAHAYCAPDADAGAALRLDAARRPVRRAPGDLLVRVHASSINPIDLAMIRGYGARILNAWRALEGGEGVEFPLTPGRDFVGTVAGAAPGAALAPGARVWGVLPPHRVGAHAQYVLAHEDWVGPAPSTLDDVSAGGALYGALTACAALRAAALPARARALVLGLGAVGHAAVQLLSDHHVVVSCSGEQADTVRALGAEPLDRHRDDYAARLRDAGPFDAVLDCAGLGGAGAASLPCAFGAYVTLSAPLLRRADALGVLRGAAAAVGDLLRDNLAAKRTQQELGMAPAPMWAPRVRWAFFAPRAQDIHMLRRRAEQGQELGMAPAPMWAPRVRWAFFAPRAQDIHMLRRRAEQGQFTVAVERAWGWRAAPEAYARAARGHARGKLVLDFQAP